MKDQKIVLRNGSKQLLRWQPDWCGLLLWQYLVSLDGRLLSESTLKTLRFLFLSFSFFFIFKNNFLKDAFPKRNDHEKILHILSLYLPGISFESDFRHCCCGNWEGWATLFYLFIISYSRNKMKVYWLFWWTQFKWSDCGDMLAHLGSNSPQPCDHTFLQDNSLHSWTILSSDWKQSRFSSKSSWGFHKWRILRVNCLQGNFECIQ